MCYQSVVAGVVVCWGSGMRTDDATRINKLIRRAGSVLEVELHSLVVVSERKMLHKLQGIMDDSHLLHDVLVTHSSTFSC